MFAAKMYSFILLCIASLLKTGQTDLCYLNQTCTIDEECPGFRDGYSVVCQHSYKEGKPLCRCTEGYVANDFLGQCVKEVQNLGDHCSHDSQCESKLGGICELGECACPSPFTIQIDGRCQSTLQRAYCRASVDGACNSVKANDCELKTVREAVRQGHPTCFCARLDQHQQSQGVLFCSPSGKKVGETCLSHDECFNPISQPYAECHKSKCVCTENTHEFQGKCYMNLEYGADCFRGEQRFRRCYSLLPESTANTVACINDQCACTGDFHYHEDLKACRKIAGPKNPHARGRH